MKLINMLYYLAIIVLIATPVLAQNTNPVVTNVSFSISGTTVTVTYDVADAHQASVTIRMEVSSDGGTSWAYDYNSPTTATGAIGTGVTTGTGKTITWSYTGAYNALFQIRIYASDETADGSPCTGTEKVYYEGGPNNDGAAYYKTIQIGTQCWLKENLNVGTRIAGSSGQTNNSTIEKYCYSDNEANCTAYGGLYQWNEAMQYVTTEGTKGICPSGWHIPTLTELQTLSTTVSNNSNALKSTGTNTSGFSGLIAGYFWSGGGYFTSFGSLTYFWSSKGANPNAYFLRYDSGNSTVTLGGDNYSAQANGFSVRCIQN